MFLTRAFQLALHDILGDGTRLNAHARTLQKRGNICAETNGVPAYTRA